MERSLAFGESARCSGLALALIGYVYIGRGIAGMCGAWDRKFAVFKVIFCSLQSNFFLTWDPTGLLEWYEEMMVQSTTIEGALSITKLYFINYDDTL